MGKNFYQENKITAITEFILDSNTYASTTFQHINKQDFYYFNGKFYEFGAEEQIFEQIIKHFPQVRLSTKEISKIITRIQDLSVITDDFDDSRYIAFINGILVKATNKLLTFNPKIYLTKLISQNFVDQSNTLSQYSKRLELLNFID